MKLTNEELADVAARLADAANEPADPSRRVESLLGGMRTLNPSLAASVVAELRELRALLATPMPCGWDTPRVVVMRGHGAEDMVAAEWLGEKPVFADEAIAIGAALMRAGLKARGGE